MKTSCLLLAFACVFVAVKVHGSIIPLFGSDPTTTTTTTDVHLHIDVPGQDGTIVTTAVNLIVGVIRQALTIVQPISPHVYDALNQILTDIENAVNGLTVTSKDGLTTLVQNLVIILQDAIKTLEALLQDAEVIASDVLYGAVQLVILKLKFDLLPLTTLLNLLKGVTSVLG